MSLFDVYPLYDVAPVKAENMYVYDEKGTKYLDLYGGHAVISIGHAHPEYVKNLSEQLNKIAFYSNAVQNPLQSELGERLPAESNCPDYQLFLCNSGAEANENALKLASFHTNRKKLSPLKTVFTAAHLQRLPPPIIPKLSRPLTPNKRLLFYRWGIWKL